MANGSMITASEYSRARASESEPTQPSHVDSPSVASVKTEAKAVQEMTGFKSSAKGMSAYNFCQFSSYEINEDLLTSKCKDHAKIYRYYRPATIEKLPLFKSTMSFYPEGVVNISAQKGGVDEDETDSKEVNLLSSVSRPADHGENIDYENSKQLLTAAYDTIENSDAVPSPVSGLKKLVQGMISYSEISDEYGEEKGDLDAISDVLEMANGFSQILEASPIAAVKGLSTVVNKVIGPVRAVVEVAHLGKDEIKKDKYLEKYREDHDQWGTPHEYINGEYEPLLTQRDQQLGLSQKKHLMKVADGLSGLVPILKIPGYVQSFHEMNEAAGRLRASVDQQKDS